MGAWGPAGVEAWAKDVKGSGKTRVECCVSRGSLPEPVGGPALSRKRYSVDTNSISAECDMDTRRLENAVWRLGLKETIIKDTKPCRLVDDDRKLGLASQDLEESILFKKAKAAIGQQMDFRSLASSTQHLNGQKILWGQMSVLKATRSYAVPSSQDDQRKDMIVHESKSNIRCSCCPPEPFGGPGMTRKRHTVDPIVLMNCGIFGDRRLENAIWRLWLKDRRSTTCGKCDGGKDTRMEEVSWHQSDELLRAKDAIGNEIDFGQEKKTDCMTASVLGKSSDDAPVGKIVRNDKHQTWFGVVGIPSVLHPWWWRAFRLQASPHA